MVKRSSLCGATTAARGTCRNRVGKPGERCPLHVGHPLGPKQILSLCFRVVEVVSVLGGAATAFEQAYPTLLALWVPLRGILMPEYFWDRGFEPKDVEQICLKSMAKDPTQRYQNTQRLADDLGRWLRGEPVHALRIGALDRAWRWSRRRLRVGSR